jgi:phage virion morphogenesis protein
MAGGINISIELGENLSQALAFAQRAAVDLSPAMQEISLNLVSTTIERFEQERGPDGVPWKPSARAIEEGGKTLQDSGALKDSIEPDFGTDFAAAGVLASGGPAIYAAIHQFGGTIRARHKKALSFAGRIVAAVRIPARPYLGFDDANRAFALEAISDHLFRAFTAGGASLAPGQ